VGSNLTAIWVACALLSNYCDEITAVWFQERSPFPITTGHLHKTRPVGFLVRSPSNYHGWRLTAVVAKDTPLELFALSDNTTRPRILRIGLCNTSPKANRRAIRAKIGDFIRASYHGTLILTSVSTRAWPVAGENNTTRHPQHRRGPAPRTTGNICCTPVRCGGARKSLATSILLLHEDSKSASRPWGAAQPKGSSAPQARSISRPITRF